MVGVSLYTWTLRHDILRSRVDPLRELAMGTAMEMVSTLSAIDITSICYRILPLVPLITASNAVAISAEWYCHVEPLTTITNPISARTLSEIFRRSYLNGAWTFLANLLTSIFSSTCMWYLLQDDPHSASSLQRSLYGYTALFGILHIFPFSAIIVRFVAQACDGKQRSKDEREIQSALSSWLKVNRVRICTDVLAAGCALAAVVVQPGAGLYTRSE
jgi:hypothetical protein